MTVAEYGVYVHLPWCRARCPYCAFAVDVRRERPHAAYGDALLRHWAAQRTAFDGAAPTTLFFGGGTPSLSPPEELARVIDAVRPTEEVSLEANPHDLDARTIDALADVGVRRLSVGVQTFDRALGLRLGRRRDAEAAPEALRRARARFHSLSIDLIFGVPGQDTALLVADLDRALAHDPDHVSLYGLTIEEGTAFAKGRLRPVDDDEWREMYEVAVERLGRAGIARYEVSNFARVGHRARHNEHYWLARPWAALGVAAHGWLPDGTRTINEATVDALIASDDGVAHRERPEGAPLAAELIGAGLRHVDGVAVAAVRARTGLTFTPPAALASLVTVEDGRVRLRPDAFAIADAVAAALIAALRPSPPSLTAVSAEYSRVMPAPRAPEDLSHLHIEVDPALLDAAVAAVDARLRPGAADGADATGEIEVDLEAGVTPSHDAPAGVSSTPPVQPSSAGAQGEPARADTRPNAELLDELRRLRQRAELARVGAARAEEEAHRQTRLRESTEAQLEESRRVHQELASDFDRLRQRTRKEAEDAERKGEERALKAFLEVYDNVERARLHQGADLARLADGLRMLVEQFRRQLARLGLERIPAARGDTFDPALHEAVIHVDAPDVAEGTVVDELLAGFRVRGRLFRPARVSVAAPRPADGDEG